jgi:hypothetical protein
VTSPASPAASASWRVLATLAGVAADGGVVGIHAIDGMAGIGKTTLAVHAAHRLAAGFPDGQFFLPLHAHTPGQRPVERHVRGKCCALACGASVMRGQLSRRSARAAGGSRTGASGQSDRVT